MTQLEMFIAEGNEKAGDLAKAGTMLDEGFMAEARAKTMQQERERCEWPYSTQPAFTAWWENGKIVKSSSRRRKKSTFSWVRKEKKRNIEPNGVLRPTSIVA